MILKLLIYVFLISFTYCAQTETINTNIIFENVDRSIDLSSQIAKITNKIIVKNNGASPVNIILFSTGEQDNSPSYLLAQIPSSKASLKVKEISLQGHADKKMWKMSLNNPLLAGETITIEVNEFWTEMIHPHPQFIAQKEKQLVRYRGNVYLYSPYKINKITTLVALHTRNVENYTKLKPTTFADGTVTYGSYLNIAPFSVNVIDLHYENSAPFLVIKNLERVIEVSHWGNIAVEETVELLHTGAKLKGSFSRYDYQRESGTGQPSIKSFKMMLPAAAVGTYYRDDIGNISTSYMRIMKDAVELELRPRFPLFGGWQTRHVIGYNVPSYEYLYNSGNDYLLKMRIMDHVFDDMVVEKLTTNIILPEGVHSTEFLTPYPVNRMPDSLHHTYLDTRGRLVITLTKNNLIENHIQDFTLKYKFASILMLQEPMLVVLSLYSLFLVVIVYVRLDFSIAKDTVSECKMRVAGICEKLLIHQDKRTYLYQLYDSQLSKLKSTKEINSFNSSIKTINNEYKTETNTITELIQKLKPNAIDVYDKLQEIQKLDKNLKDLYSHHQSLYVDKLIPGKIGRSAFVDAENNFYKKRNDILDSINTIYKSLE
ncbi:uncharacterized protein CBL_14164 [Carabus blaptoides fortunei]